MKKPSLHQDNGLLSSLLKDLLESHLLGTYQKREYSIIFWRFLSLHMVYKPNPLWFFNNSPFQNLEVYLRDMQKLTHSGITELLHALSNIKNTCTHVKILCTYSQYPCMWWCTAKYRLFYFQAHLSSFGLYVAT